MFHLHSVTREGKSKQMAFQINQYVFTAIVKQPS